MNIDEFNRMPRIRQTAAEVLPDLIRERLSDLEPEDVYTRETIRNNGQQLLGISVVPKDSDISPCIYVESYIPPDPSILEQEGIWDRIADHISEDFRYALDVVEPQPEDLFRPEDIEEHLVLKLVNYQWNEEFLKGYPHKIYQDLAALLEWEVVCGKRQGTIHITNDILHRWGKTFDEMYEVALSNTMRKYPGRIAPLSDILEEYTGGSLENVDSPFYYIGTERSIQGCVAMLYPGLLREVYQQMGEPYYLIPSSINELLALPVSFDSDPEKLKELIWEVNTYMVERTEVLSNVLYIYRPELDDLEIIARN